MAIKPIKGISATGDSASKQKDTKTNPKVPAAKILDQPGLTEQFLNSTSSYKTERSAEYRHDAFVFLRSFRRKHGAAVDYYVMVQRDFLNLAKTSPSSAEELKAQIIILSGLSDVFKEDFYQQRIAFKNEGVDGNWAKVDAFIGFEHFFARDRGAALLASQAFLAAAPENKAIFLATLELALPLLEELNDKLMSISKHPENTEYFLFSKNRPAPLNKLA